VDEVGGNPEIDSRGSRPDLAGRLGKVDPGAARPRRYRQPGEGRWIGVEHRHVQSQDLADQEGRPAHIADGKIRSHHHHVAIPWYGGTGHHHLLGEVVLVDA
jgi:hypothetical protein